MNLIHGFYSKNTSINPDCVHMQKQCYVSVLREMYVSSWARETIDSLYTQKSAAETSTGNRWETLTEYFDAIGAEIKDPLQKDHPKYQFMTYFCDIIYLIEKHKLDGNQKLRDLILEDKEYDAAELHERQLHNAVKMLICYSNSL